MTKYLAKKFKKAVSSSKYWFLIFLKLQKNFGHSIKLYVSVHCAVRFCALKTDHYRNPMLIEFLEH